MSELEVQAAFREEVLRDLEHERTTLENLTDRVAKLEKTVIDGNGHPSLTVQVKELETKVDSLSKEVGILRDQMGKLSELNNNVIEIKTQLNMKDRSATNWWAFALVIVTVVGTALVQHFVH